MSAICLYCGAHGDGLLPPEHEWGLPCPQRGTDPCPLCGADPGEPCTITNPHSERFGMPTRDHAARPSPSLALDVLGPKSGGNVVDLAAARRARR